jgi:hypothetical protein
MTGLAQKWWLRSATAKGRDLLDGLFVLPGETFSMRC